MRHKYLHSIMFFVLLLAFCVPASYSQQASKFFLANDNWDGHGIYEVDIFVQSLDASPIELAALTLGLKFPDVQRNGGTITATMVALSSGLTNTAQIPTSFNATGTMVSNTITYRQIKIAAKTPPGSGGGSLLSITAPGTRICRLHLANTVDFVISGINLISFQMVGEPVTSGALYPCALNAYESGINVNITPGATYASNLAGPLLPVELSAFASTAQGRTVVLNWSTKTEKNSDRFEVERSLASTTTWTTVGTVKAAVLSNSPKNYSYTDTKLQSGKYQYRLKMVDNNGSFTYSSVEGATVAIPKDFAVSQNYPNPFNPTTKIDYQVPVDAKVIMEVYNIAGQRVFELVNQDQSAGYYTVDFGSSVKLASGVYIYRIAAVNKATGNNFSAIKKMMVLK